MTLATETVANMVQGVSQQAALVRRTTQCDSQFDCLNQPAEGCVGRPGLEHLAVINTGTFTGAFFYDIIRDKTERYTLMLGTDGTPVITNILTGEAATVEVVDNDAVTYLANLPDGAIARESFCATSADDVTFIGNKTVQPAMGNDASPARPHEALFFVKAGGYLVTYTINITYAGTVYTWTYTTPDNSVESNAADITTDAICYSLYNAMVTDATNPIASGLGFNIHRVGNLIRLWREDGNDFDIETIDGQNNAMLIGLKEVVSGFDKLPQSGFPGMVFRVIGDAASQADDYYVQFNANVSGGASTTNGVWEETVAPGVATNLDATTMPVSLVNDDVNHFTLGLATWQDRIAGDGAESARDPSFVGHYIEDIFFDQRRLAIMTKASCVWSKVNGPFTFFPDTVQTQLATAPIDIEVKASKRIAILHKALQVDAYTFLWAEGRQFLVSHGDNSTFSDQTIEVDPSSSYEWNEGVEPVQMGIQVMFGTQVGNYTTFTALQIQQGQVVGDSGITDHVPKYVPKNLLLAVGSDTVKKMILYSEETPSQLYVYEFKISQNQWLQSAWNTWRLPSNCHVLHLLIDKDILYVWAQRPDGVHILKCSLQPDQEDPEGGYLTCLDMRVDESKLTLSYSAVTDQTTITLPFNIGDDNAHVLASGDDQNTVQLVTRSSTGSGDTAFYRGLVQTLVSVDHTDAAHTVLKVHGDITAGTFYCGLRRRAERTENIFYIHDSQDGYVYADRVQVAKAVLAFASTGYFRGELLNKKGVVVRQQRMEGKSYGDPTAVYDAVVLADGNFDFAVNNLNTDAKVRWVSDTYLPSSWQGLVWHYNPTLRAQPGK